MTKELLEVLEALCGMWEQYCGGEWGHEFMSAGEEAEEVLEKYDLLIHVKGVQQKVDEEKLKYYRNLVKQNQ